MVHVDADHALSLLILRDIRFDQDLVNFLLSPAIPVRPAPNSRTADGIGTEVVSGTSDPGRVVIIADCIVIGGVGPEPLTALFDRP
jgi:hypothetical protein